MDYLQYPGLRNVLKKYISKSFKPYYKWITFNTPSEVFFIKPFLGFKPYYKWITFNT